MNHPNLPDHRAEDHILMSVEELSSFAQLSRAFIQLCVDAGCPLEHGRLSQALLLNWLAENYTQVRALCGLPALASIEGVPEPAYTDLQMANLMLTMLQFAESRSTSTTEKAQIRAVLRLVERAVEA
jgi:hypothetical protein